MRGVTEPEVRISVPVASVQLMNELAAVSKRAALLFEAAMMQVGVAVQALAKVIVTMVAEVGHDPVHVPVVTESFIAASDPPAVMAMVGDVPAPLPAAGVGVPLEVMK